MKNFFRTLIALILSATMLSACSAGVETPGASSVPGQTDASQSEGKSQTEFDRKETLYVVTNMGHSPNSFNPLDGSPSWPVGMQQVLVYETAFMMNMLTQELEPLVGDSYSWTDDLTLEVKLNPAAKFNDGSVLTSEDMKYSYELGKKYDIMWSTYWKNIDTVEATDPQTVRIKMKADDPNMLNVLDSLQIVPIVPKAVWGKVEEENNNDIAGIRKFTNKQSPVASGPYNIYRVDDQSIVLKRNDDYWGVVRFGKLPTPKYIYQPFYKSNDTVTMDLKEGKLDWAQVFIPKIWDIMEENQNIKTYLDDFPYHVPPACLP